MGESVPSRPKPPGCYFVAERVAALQQDTPSNLITIDKDYLDRVTLRRRLIDEKGPAVHGHLPRGKESVAELYTYLLHDHLPARYPTMFKLSSDGSTFENTVTTKTLPVQAPEDANAALRSLGETVEEDIFLLHETTDGHLCVAFVCCFPSGFDPSVKFGSLLKDIHGPVPSYSKIGPSMERFFSKLKVGESVKRLNVRPNSLLMLHVDMASACVNADGVFARGQWSVQTHGRLYTLGNHITDDELEVASDNKIDVDQVLLHTHLMLIPTDSEVQTYFRVELQTLTRLPRTQAVMFSFKTYLYSIRQIKEEGSGPELADAIEGLKSGNAPGMWRYKSAVRWGPAVCNYLRSGV
jgi:hypothetical protein